MVSRQLELGFEQRPVLKSAGRARRRSNRANWWFEQMRGAVSHADDWPAAPMPAQKAHTRAPFQDTSTPGPMTRHPMGSRTR